MAESVTTADLYEGTYYLLGDCELTGIEATRVNGSVCCRLTFQGEKLASLQREYFGGGATGPLFPFRRAFGQISALVYTAKKKARQRIRQERGAAGGAP